jgi:hypothetical protein
MRELVAEASSPADLTELLQGARDLCNESGGSRACVQLMEASKQLVFDAGGPKQVLCVSGVFLLLASSLSFS